MSTSAELQFRVMGYDDPLVQHLVEQVQAEYVQMYGSPDEAPVDSAEFDPPAGMFLLAVRDGEPVAMGGWRRREDMSSTAEIKRMFVVGAGRRRGVGRAMLTELERRAVEAGLGRMILETGSQQPAAVAMYEEAGYRRMAGYGFYQDSPQSISMVRELG